MTTNISTMLMQVDSMSIKKVYKKLIKKNRFGKKWTTLIFEKKKN